MENDAGTPQWLLVARADFEKHFTEDGQLKLIDPRSVSLETREEVSAALFQIRRILGLGPGKLKEWRS